MAENKISYTNKDYTTLMQAFIDAIPSLTDKWKNFAEDDPGIVLLKLAAFTGDMLCYNMDYQVRETFPQTATQRKHAASMYSLIGYKMHWYQSAVCNVVFRFTRPSYANTGIPTNAALILTVPNFTQLASEDGTPYVVIGSDLDRTMVLPVLASGQQEIDNYVEATMTAVQGVAFVQNNIYPSNITSEGRIYFSNTTVDEDPENNQSRPHMQLILCDGKTDVEIENWIKVDNLLNTREEGKYYEFKVDDKDAPYIQLCENYANYLPLTDTKYFKLRYIISDGSEGNVSSNVNFTTQALTTVVYNSANVDVSDYLTIRSNTQSDAGNDPETLDAARVSAAREAQVLNTAVTLFDYETLVKSVDNIRSCYAQDLATTAATDVVKTITRAAGFVEATSYIEYSLLTSTEALTTQIKPNTITVSALKIEGSPAVTTVLAEYTDNGASRFLDETPELVGRSFVVYNNGALSLNLSALATLADMTHIKLEYSTELTPYTVKLNTVMNNYHYITDYARTSMAALLDRRKIVSVQYIITEATLKCVPYNIVLHSTEPYTSSSSLLPYLREVAYKALYDFYDSGERTFGERINYADVVNLIQASDTKIEVADVLYPERSFKIPDGSYPMLGDVAISLSDDPDTAFLQDFVFSTTNYATLVSTLIGDANFDVVVSTNTGKDEITDKLDLQTTVYINATTGAVDLGGTAHNVEWWCSRSDIIITSGINIGTLQTDNISMDTPITLFCKVYSGNSSMIIPVSIDLTVLNV